MTFHLVMIEYGGVLARTSGLTKKQHCFSILLGASTLVANYVLKKLPEIVTNLLVIGQGSAQLQRDAKKNSEQ